MDEYSFFTGLSLPISRLIRYNCSDKKVSRVMGNDHQRRLITHERSSFHVR